MNEKKYTLELEEKTLTVELNSWAEQAHGSALVRLGDTTVLATAVMSKHPREGGGDFFPLTVDYEEKFYAVGKILGSRFVKRETRPSEEAILAARVIDRSIRPRFNQRMRNEVQVIVTVLSMDPDNDPDIPALIGVSLALSLSPIPWDGPIAGVRIGKTNGSFILNPITSERLEASLDLIISGTKDRLNMIEAGAQEMSETDFAEAAEWGHPFIQKLIEFQESIIRDNPVQKREVPVPEIPTELIQLMKDKFATHLESAVYTVADSNGGKKKADAYASESLLREEWLKTAAETYPDTFHRGTAEHVFNEEINDILHRRILKDGQRPDGRTHNELRPLSGQIATLPRIHGSGLFMRGETHVLSVLTLGAPGDEMIVEGMEIRMKRHFLHQYNFPPFSTGETKPMRGPGRREIGHGALAGKALLPLIPPKTEFPYTIRIVSEVISSNGSSSMASVCGSSLALMDAGVPIKKAVGGAAMGLIMDAEGKNYKVLTDIQGPEDHHGDMDFKVAGTRDGITAVQMDVKIDGITLAILRDALSEAHSARMRILDTMDAVIKEPRPELSPWAPRVQTLKINPEKIGALIGPGGKIINEIITETGVAIDIEDDGTVFVTSETAEGMTQALARINQITKEFKPGELLEGKVTRIFEFGAMVEVAPRQEGLVHVSELAPWRVEKVTDIVNTGMEIPVMVRGVDDQGRLNLSLKDVPGRYTQEDIEKQRTKNQGGGPHPSGGDHFRRR